MPDITMCKNSKCSVKDNCYRFKAEPDPIYQSYAFFRGVEKDDCFYPIHSKLQTVADELGQKEV